jgi:membrane protein implicated in regulation of membrane protease activity
MKQLILDILEMVYDYIKDASGVKMFLSGAVIAIIVNIISSIFELDATMHTILFMIIMIVSAIIFVAAYYFHNKKQPGTDFILKVDKS